jgi:hypothetical protein
MLYSELDPRQHPRLAHHVGQETLEEQSVLRMDVFRELLSGQLVRRSPQDALDGWVLIAKGAIGSEDGNKACGILDQRSKAPLALV